MCGLYEPDSGSILIDGVDIRQIDPADIRRNVGFMLQETWLFSGSIKENIRLGNEKITLQDVKVAAEVVNADGFINDLENKYEHQVAERGSTLSGGQQQLLSFARALAFKPEILILDEATSAIDTETEQLIQDAISKLMHGRTSIVIAHRLSTIQNANQILVLHHGQIRERGRHDELVKQGGIYAKLHALNYDDTNK